MVCHTRVQTLFWGMVCHGLSLARPALPTLLGQDHTATVQRGSGPVCPAHFQGRDTQLVPSVGPGLAHGGIQRITQHPQLTIKDVKLICRVTKPCKRQNPGGESPCLGASTFQPLHHQDTAGHSPALSSLSLGWQENQKRTHRALPKERVPPTVGGEVVGHILTQTHSPDALLELVHDRVADKAAPSCTQENTSVPPGLALARSPPWPYTRLKAQGAFSSAQFPPYPFPHSIWGQFSRWE